MALRRGSRRLNTPGVSDGVFEFWVDDELQNSSHDLDWRGTWTEYGLNLVTVQNSGTAARPGSPRVGSTTW